MQEKLFYNVDKVSIEFSLATGRDFYVMKLQKQFPEGPLRSGQSCWTPPGVWTVMGAPSLPGS